MKTPATFHIYGKMVKVERRKQPVTKEDSTESEYGFNENNIYVHIRFVHVLLIFGKQKKMCKLVIVL